jgi:hypothetical protein
MVNTLVLFLLFDDTRKVRRSSIAVIPTGNRRCYAVFAHAFPASNRQCNRSIAPTRTSLKNAPRKITWSVDDASNHCRAHTFDFRGNYTAKSTHIHLQQEYKT